MGEYKKIYLREKKMNFNVENIEKKFWLIKS